MLQFTIDLLKSEISYYEGGLCIDHLKLHTKLHVEPSIIFNIVQCTNIIIIKYLFDYMLRVFLQVERDFFFRVV